MAKTTAADLMIDILVDWGVEVVFGLPGDGINGLMESLRTREDKVRFIQVRHEESAAFMACAYAKFTGKLGVCLATSGPGGLHLLNGLYDAKLDGQPVLAISGHHYHDLIDTHAQQDVNLDRVFADVAVYSARVMGPAHVASVTHLACRTALSRRGVAHLNFPVDLQEHEVDEAQRSKRNIAGHNVQVFARAAGLPSEEDLARAAEIRRRGITKARREDVPLLARAREPMSPSAPTEQAPIARAAVAGHPPRSHLFVAVRPNQEPRRDQ